MPKTSATDDAPGGAILQRTVHEHAHVANDREQSDHAEHEVRERGHAILLAAMELGYDSKMKVEKEKFDSLLGRLIKARPIKNAEIKSPRPPKKPKSHTK
jgi:hypothetical protein